MSGTPQPGMNAPEPVESVKDNSDAEALERVLVTLSSIKTNCERLKQLQSECYRWNLQNHKNLKTIILAINDLNELFHLPAIRLHDDTTLSIPDFEEQFIGQHADATNMHELVMRACITQSSCGTKFCSAWYRKIEIRGGTVGN